MERLFQKIFDRQVSNFSPFNMNSLDFLNRAPRFWFKSSQISRRSIGKFWAVSCLLGQEKWQLCKKIRRSVLYKMYGLKTHLRWSSHYPHCNRRESWGWSSLLGLLGDFPTVIKRATIPITSVLWHARRLVTPLQSFNFALCTPI